MSEIIGILNVTRDSFSDGGRYLRPDAAIAHARQLIADGASVIDVGAESTHPDAEDVSADEEIARLNPILDALNALRSDPPSFRVSVDTHKPQVMRHVLGLGVDIINDVTGFENPDSIAALHDGRAHLIVMHSRSPTARARRDGGAADPHPPVALGGDLESFVGEVVSFFKDRIAALREAGIRRERLILDPGMGFFLGADAELSLAVLRHLDRIKVLGLPICISVSRKSFIGAVLADPADPRPVDRRSAGTLAAEIWAHQHGVAYVRTHDVGALRDAVTMLRAIGE